ncbi:histidine phosphatase family protein [Spelaeicoccus albus]|uniref:Broad specificity phosphatase PhoE n=1 Tax=Spelaeicoccus albus TaxID=1280376 RepID=A0A7Z0IHJ7_9MICO|nr:histidine phosphatase family protein [Spelaeicoccus albus]NYI67759.1 broad specificity phosphatase PhoE [Spelaeicoccus albus]
MHIHLVRHGTPLIDLNRQPSEWDLDPKGLAEVDRLASSGVLPGDARWVSSNEPKAVQTANRLTDKTVETDSRLCEQKRPSSWVKDFAIHIHRTLVTEAASVADGWEPAAETRSRVAEAARAIMESTPGRDLVLVGHSTPWLLLVSELTGRPVDLAAWERMMMPDYCMLDDSSLTVPWGSWAAAA